MLIALLIVEYYILKKNKIFFEISVFSLLS